MRNRLIVMSAAALAVALPALAHDVWMQPLRFQLPVNAAIPYQVWAGHGVNREIWNVGVDRVVALKSIGPVGTIDLKPAIRASGQGLIRFSAAGTYVVAMESSHAQSDLPSLRFNDYAAEEGLTPIIAHRARTGTAQRNGREIYSRRTKMLIKVGNLNGPARHVTRPIGMTLEIVTEADPYAVAGGAALPVRIFYQGRPLPGALVKLTNLAADAKPIAQMRSDRAGRAIFRHPGQGNWQFNVIWSRPITGNAAAEFDTTFSSLTFGD